MANRSGKINRPEKNPVGHPVRKVTDIAKKKRRCQSLMDEIVETESKKQRPPNELKRTIDLRTQRLIRNHCLLNLCISAFKCLEAIAISYFVSHDKVKLQRFSLNSWYLKYSIVKRSIAEHYESCHYLRISGLPAK